MRIWGMGAIFAAMLGMAAQAAPIDQSEARQHLFPVQGVDLLVVRARGLDADQLGVVEAILTQARAQDQANYYGAIAVSPTFFQLMAQDPSQAAVSGLLQISEKFHSADAAEAFALRACNAARASGQAACVIAARVVPQGWTAQPLQMSVAATGAFQEYLKARGSKAFAISPATTAYATARGEAAGVSALTSCNSAAQALGQADCVLVIQD